MSAVGSSGSVLLARTVPLKSADGFEKHIGSSIQSVPLHQQQALSRSVAIVEGKTAGAETVTALPRSCRVEKNSLPIVH